MRECQSCGKQYEGNFCPYCGAKWVEDAATERTCPDCGATVAAGMRFCANCGYDFAGKKSTDEGIAEKQMQAALRHTENFMETIPSMLRIGNAVLCAIFSVLLWFLFSLPVTTVLGESIGNLYQFMNGTTVLGALLGRIDEIVGVMYLAGTATLYALIVLCVSIAGRKEKKEYVKHSLYNLVFLVFHVVFFVVGCIVRSKVSDFGLTVGACATSLMICSAVFFVISLALVIPALVLSAKMPLTPEEQAEKEAKKAALIAKAKKIAKPACAVGAVALTVIIIVCISTNIFRVGKVDNIAIGDSAEAVLGVLGEPYEKRTEENRLSADYVRAPYDDVWKYYSKEYTDIFDRMTDVEGELDGADSILDVGGLVGIGDILGDVGSITGDALKLHYKYIEVAFKDGAVVAVYLDKDRTATEELDGELKQKSGIYSLTFTPFEYTGCEGGGYGKTQLTVEYQDGSYACDLVSVEKKNEQLVWTDFKGEHTYSPSSNAWNGTEIGTLQHAVDAWVLSEAATCTEDGKEKGVCEYCNRTQTKTLPATGHSVEQVDIILEPPCVREGLKLTEQCANCKKQFKTETIPAIGSHETVAVDVVAKEPTCTKNGTRYTEQCTVCSEYTAFVPIPATGHTPTAVDVIAKEPTCTKNGTRYTEQCTVCSEYTASETIPATGHTPSVVDVIAKEPTCTKNGTRYTEQCTVCSEYTASETIPATGHQNPNGTCSVCSVVLSLGNNTHIRIDTEGKKDANGSYILFGEYPQTIKADNVTVTTTQDSRGYYLGSDGFYYAKVTANPYGNYTFSSGESVEDGTVYYFKVEPIRWRILSESGGKALILCDSIIANKAFDAYNGGNYDNNYADSTIRAWLNAEFYSTAFNDLQKALVNTVTVDNSAASTGDYQNPYVCENTSDKVFLLSYKEVTNPDYGFVSSGGSYDVARRKTVSDYARATGAWMSTRSSYYGNGWWWLRSPYYCPYIYAYSARVMCIDGSADSYNVSGDSFGVVPALQIRIG